jgi:Holliday junction resolvase RusA-like endonuclease
MAAIPSTLDQYRPSDVRRSYQEGLNFIERPFGIPEDIVLDVPVPLSVNRSRKIDWRSHAKFKAWQKQADAHYLLVKRKLQGKKITGRYELIIIIDEKQSGCDGDNLTKSLTDFVVRCGLVTDDSPKYCRQWTVKFGVAPAGCRIILRPIE